MVERDLHENNTFPFKPCTLSFTGDYHDTFYYPRIVLERLQGNGFEKSCENDIISYIAKDDLEERSLDSSCSEFSELLVSKDKNYSLSEMNVDITENSGELKENNSICEDDTNEKSDSKVEFTINVDDDSPCNDSSIGCGHSSMIATDNTTITARNPVTSYFEFNQDEFQYLGTEKAKRASSLRAYSSSPDTSHLKKVVRFADVMGLDLESVKHIMNCELPPIIPNYVYKELQHTQSNNSSNSVILSNVKDKFFSICFVPPGIIPKFTQEVLVHNVKLENCQVNDSDMTISGLVRVANIGFSKSVIIRCTTNNWLTFDDTVARYVAESVNGTDRFSFILNIPKYFGPGNQLCFAILFQCHGADFWDNNSGKNYEVKCFAKGNSSTEMRSDWMKNY